METVRRVIYTAILLLVQLTVFGQNGPLYKAVIYNHNGVELIGMPISVRLSISTLTGTAVFTQENSITTDSLGVLTVRMTGGTITTGNQNTLKNLDYTGNNYYLKVEVDTTQSSLTGYHTYSNSMIGPAFFSYNSFFSDTAAYSRDNLFNKINQVTAMKESGGILISSITRAQRDSIQNPANGLLVFLIDSKDFSFFNGSDWIDLSTIKDIEDFRKEILTRFALREGF